MKDLQLNAEQKQTLLVPLKYPASDLRFEYLDAELRKVLLSPSRTWRYSQYLKLGNVLHKLCLFLLLEQSDISGIPAEQQKKRVWPRGLVIPVKTEQALKKIYATNGFFEAMEKWIARVWSSLLMMFVANDLYLYLAYPEQRFAMTLMSIFFTYAQHEKSLTASLVSPLVWPELLAAPGVWGAIKAIKNRQQTQVISFEKTQQLITVLENYSSGLCVDVCGWLLPKYALRNTLDIIKQALLWDNRLSAEQRKTLQMALQNFVRRAHKFSQVYGLEILGELANGTALQDFSKIAIDELTLTALFDTKIQALQELRSHAFYDLYTQSTSTCYQKTLQPLPRYLIANYLLWCTDITVPKWLRPLFVLYDSAKFYFKAKFLYTLYLGFSRMLQQYLEKRACLQAGKLWLYMASIADYQCSYCGDLPVFYRNMFAAEACLQDYLRQPRNASDIASVLARLDLTTVFSLDLSRQKLIDAHNGLSLILQVLQRKAPWLQALYLNMSQSLLGIHSMQALAEYLTKVDLKILSLRGQRIGVAGIELLIPGLLQSKLQSLDLAYAYIQTAGAQKLAAILRQVPLQWLDLFGCFIQDDGAAAIAIALPASSLQHLHLAVNNITDVGLRKLAQGLWQSKIQSLDLWNNAICSGGVTAFAKILAKIPLLNLVLGSNPCIGNNGTAALAYALPGSSLVTLDLSYVGMQSAGAELLGKYIAKSAIASLQIKSNKLGLSGVIALARALYTSVITSLDLSYCGLDLAAIKALATGLLYSKIKVLVLEGNHLTDSAIALLAENIPAALQTVSFASNAITWRGAAAFAAALNHSNIVDVDLSSNQISDQGSIILANALTNSALQKLSLAFNQIGTVGAVHFAQQVGKSLLQQIIFMGNPIGSVGGQAFAAALQNSQLQIVSLGGCGLDDRAVIALAKRLAGSLLRVLALGYNNITNKGVEILAGMLTTITAAKPQLLVGAISLDARRFIASAEPNTLLDQLSLQGNYITEEGAKALCLVLPQSNINIGNLNLLENPINVSKIDLNACVSSAASMLRPWLSYQTISRWGAQFAQQSIAWKNRLLEIPAVLSDQVLVPGALSECAAKPAATSMFSYAIPLICVTIFLFLLYKLLFEYIARPTSKVDKLLTLIPAKDSITRTRVSFFFKPKTTTKMIEPMRQTTQVFSRYSDPISLRAK